MSEIPVDVKNLMQEFLAQQQEQEARRAAEKQQRLLERSQINSPRGQMKAKEIQRYAVSFGLAVESGRGRHGIHLVAPNGSECPLPIHGGGRTLATGTQNSIVAFIQQNRVKR